MDICLELFSLFIQKVLELKNFGGVTTSLEIKKGRDLTPPMQLQIKIPIQITIDVPKNKKIPIQELASAIKGIEAKILGRVLEEIDRILISSIQKEYGKNEYHKHQKEERTIVTQLGRTAFSLTRIKEKSTKTFCPLYNIEFE